MAALLRATRQTELADRFPLHVVCAWIGNSQPVAMKHYLQVTDEHFAEAVQNPVQPVRAAKRTEAHGKPQNPDGARKNVISEHLDMCLVGGRGLEPLTSSL